MDLAARMVTKRPTMPLALVEYPEEKFTLRSLTGADRNRFQSEAKKNPEQAGILLVALSLGDENGSRVFTDDRLTECGQLPGRVLDFVAIASREFNFLDQEGYERAKKASPKTAN